MVECEIYEAKTSIESEANQFETASDLVAQVRFVQEGLKLEIRVCLMSKRGLLQCSSKLEIQPGLFYTSKYRPRFEICFHWVANAFKMIISINFPR